MHIAFRFDYAHDNGLFTRLLERVKDVSVVSVTSGKVGTLHTLEASGEQEELESLAELVSSMIPNSLFLADYALEEVETSTASSFSPADLDLPHDVPYCPECHVRIIKTLDPFAKCSVCGSDEGSLSLEAVSESAGLSTIENSELFMQVAERLIESGETKLLTYNGIRKFTLSDSQSSNDKGILICDPSDISDSFVITQGELDALMMVERPTVRLRPKLRYRLAHQLERPFYPVFFADDKITLALSEVLRRKGIKTLFVDQVSTLRVASTLDQHLIIKEGRDLLPWKHPLVLHRPSACVLDEVQALSAEDGLVVMDRSTVIAGEHLLFADKYDQTLSDSAIRFERAHAALRSIVLEHGLDGQSLCGVYLSRRHHSQITGFSKRIGYSAMVDIDDDLPSQPKAVLEAIAQMDENGSRLIENFKTQYPELDSVLSGIELEGRHVSAMVRLWGMAAVIMGLYEGDDIEQACEMLEATAIEFNGKSGPRIDYKVISTSSGYALDLFRAIRSAISFKLAGVDDHLISFGFIDSLADFIASQTEAADANIAITGVTISGSLFENRQLTMRTYNAIASNFPVYRNRRLGIDGANIAIGAIALGSE